MLKKYLTCLYIFFFVATQIDAQTIPLDAAVRTGKLPNGFTYYIRHNEEPKNRVQLYLVNKVGSVLETGDQQGLAHFMEHMNFNGTKNFPKNELVSYLQKSGVRFGADLNAYTSFDETVYQLPIPTDDPVILQNGFKIMRDWASDATLEGDEIDKERGVVFEEMRLGRGASDRMDRKIWPVMLNGSRYAYRLPIGKEEILKHAPYSAIRSYHSDWYRPDLQALVVVGDIDAGKTEALVRKMFSDLKNPQHEKPRTKYTVGLNGQNHFLAVTDPEQTETVLQVLVKHRAEKLITEPDYTRSMQRQLFNYMLRERFNALSLEPNLPFIEAGAGIENLFGGLDMFTLNLRARENNIEAGFIKTWTEVERVKRFGFTDRELERAKLSYLSRLETSFREKDRTNSESLVNEYQRLFLSQEASPGIEWEYHFVKNNLGKITLDSIRAVVKEYVRQTNRDIFIMAPEKDKEALPDSATVAGWINAVSQSALEPHTDQVIAQSLITEKPVPGTVVTTKKLDSIGVTVLSLSNGVNIILKPTPFKNDEIRFAGFSEGGTSLYPDDEFQSADNASLIAGFGVAGFDPAQLEKILAGKRLTIEPYIEERWQGIGGASTPKDLETALQLVNLYFTKPRLDQNLFTNIISNTRDLLKNRYSDPDNTFSDTMQYVLGNYHLRRSPPSIEKLGQIDPERAYQIYKERFSDAFGFTFVFTGSFNTDSIIPLIETYIGSLPAENKNEKARDLGIHIPNGQMTKKVFKGTEDKATVRMVFSGDYHYSAAANMQLNALKEVLLIKLIQRLRENESEVYSPKVDISYVKYPQAVYAFTVGFGCAPANADHLMELVEKEIRNLRESGPPEEDIVKFKAEYLRTREISFQTNAGWLNYLAAQTQNRETLMQLLDYRQRLEKVTGESVQQAAKQYLSGVNELKFELLPETK